MKYRPREGVVLINLCGTFLLVPTRAASEACPGILTIPVIEVIVWRWMEKGKEYAEILDVLAKFAMKKPEEMQGYLDKILNKLYEKGFLVAAEEDDDAR